MGRKSRGDWALEVLRGEVSLFQAQGTQEVFVDLPGGRTYPVEDERFRRWAMAKVFSASQGPVVLRREEWNTLVDGLKALAQGAPTYPLFVRVGGFAGEVYWDLGEGVGVVRIGPEGWEVVQDVHALPVRFLRSAYMHPLPLPERAKPEEVFALRELLSFAEGDPHVEESLLLLVGWLLGTLNPHGSYPVLLLRGEKGAGKTTAARVLKSLVDPHRVLSMAPSRDAKDLMVAATWSHIVVMDNVSALSQEFADSLCRMATGEAMYLRKLYTDQAEHVAVYRRPLILTSVVDPMTQPDLIDRSLVVELYRVPDTERKPETEVYQRLQALRPRIMGALIELVSLALRSTGKPDFVPRMADFALFVWRGLGGIGLGDAFLEAYERSRGMLEISAVYDDVVISLLVSYIGEKGSFSGTAQDLLQELEAYAGYKVKPKGWPGNPLGLSHRIARFRSSLKALGIDVRKQHTRRGNIWTIAREVNQDLPDAGSDDGLASAVVPGVDEEFLLLRPRAALD